MMQIKNLNISFGDKTLLNNFSAVIHNGNRIGIMGRNGSGKSTLLRKLSLLYPVAGYIPQIISKYSFLSGGEKFNKFFSQIIHTPIWLLDEPTNHLDMINRKGLFRKLKKFSGILIVATHDKEILREYVDQIWIFEDGKIKVFQGKYDDYMNEIKKKKRALDEKMQNLKNEKKQIHLNLMKEQKRRAKSVSSGAKKIANKKWMKSVGNLKKTKAEKSQGQKIKIIDNKKKQILKNISNLKLPEKIVPHFTFQISELNHKKMILIKNGSAGYEKKEIIQNFNLEVFSGERVALCGKNGSGKSTILQTILNNPCINKNGEWKVFAKNIGYLDQFYQNLDKTKTVYETVPDREILSDFLFRTSEEVQKNVNNLSGGEKVRLSLAQISHKTPDLLILDEITNNLDLETKEHVTEVLHDYPGTLLVVSHDEDFLKRIKIVTRIDL